MNLLGSTTRQECYTGDPVECGAGASLSILEVDKSIIHFYQMASSCQRLMLVNFTSSFQTCPDQDMDGALMGCNPPDDRSDSRRSSVCNQRSRAGRKALSVPVSALAARG